MRAGWLVSGFGPVEGLPGWSGSPRGDKMNLKVPTKVKWLSWGGGTRWTLKSYQGEMAVLGGDKMYPKVLAGWGDSPRGDKMYQLSDPRISASSHSLIPEKQKMFESRHGKAAKKKARNECPTFTQKSHGLSWKLFFLCFPLSEKLSWSNQWYHFWTERNQYTLNSQLLWSEATTYF